MMNPKPQEFLKVAIKLKTEQPNSLQMTSLMETIISNLYQEGNSFLGAWGRVNVPSILVKLT